MRGEEKEALVCFGVATARSRKRAPGEVGGRGQALGATPEAPGPSRLARLVTSSCEQEADRRPIKPRLAKPRIAATTIFLYFDHSAQTLRAGRKREEEEEEEGGGLSWWRGRAA